MFITFEGIDGSGKSTLAAMLCDRLSAHGRVLLTREPGGWEGGASLRSMVLDGSLEHPWSEAFLFMLDRAEHVQKVILPALKKGEVICERYHDSTLAYQVWGRGLPEEIFVELAKLAEFPIPDLTVLFDIDVQKSMERVAGRGIPDTFEKEKKGFMERVREGYLAMARREPERWAVVDASLTLEEVYNNLLMLMKKRGFLSAV